LTHCVLILQKAELDDVNKERKDILSNIGADDFDEEGEDLDLDDLEEKVDDKDIESTSSTSTSSDHLISSSSSSSSQSSSVDPMHAQQIIHQSLQIQQQPRLSPPIQQQQQQQLQIQQQPQLMNIQQLQRLQNTNSPSLPGIGQLFASLNDRKDILQLMDHSLVFMTDPNGNIVWTSNAVQQLNITSNVGSNILNHPYNTMKTNQVYDTILKGQYQYAEIDIIIPTISSNNNNNTSNNDHHSQQQCYQYMSVYALKCDGVGYSWSVRYRTLSTLPLERIIPSSCIAIHPSTHQSMSSYSNTSAAAEYTLHSVNAFLIDVK
jgi:hypothetical protein